MKALYIKGIEEHYEILEFSEENFLKIEDIHCGDAITCSFHKDSLRSGQKAGQWKINIPAMDPVTPDKANVWAETIALAAELCGHLNQGKSWKIEELDD